MSGQNRVGKAFIWKFLERSSVTGIQFVVQIMLARILTPDDFGVIAILLMFIQVSNVFIQSGFNSALIQAREVDDDDYSSVLWLNLGLATVFYVGLFLGSPFIASFYNNPIITSTLRGVALVLFPGAINSVQIAHMSRELNFKVMFLANLISSIVAGGLGLASAYMGFGIFALVVQQVANQLFITIVMSVIIKWRPRFVIRLERLRQLFAYGGKILVSGLIDVVYNQSYSAIVGKLFDRSILGYYTKAVQFPMTVTDTLNGAISNVLLPVMSKSQDDRVRLKQMMRRSIIMSSYVVFPTMIGMGVCAEPIIRVLLTDKWLPAVPFLWILCLTYVWFPIHTSNLQAINAIGRSDIFLKLEIVKKVLGVVALVACIPLGVMAMTWSKVLIAFLGSVINAYPNKKLLHYSYLEQLRDILPNIASTLLMAVCVGAIGFVWPWGTFLQLIVQIIAGMGIYLLLSKLFRLEGMGLVLSYFLKRRQVDGEAGEDGVDAGEDGDGGAGAKG